MIQFSETSVDEQIQQPLLQTLIHIKGFTPSTAPSSAGLMGDVGKRMFERSEFPLDAQQGEQRRGKAVAGSPSFWVLLLGEARKSTSPKGEMKTLKLYKN